MSSANRPPPRFVPTLTEVVQPVAPGSAAPVPATALQDQIIQRVMQRVDLTLERRLREAVATLVLEKTRDLGPLLREEIEIVVRQTVSEAVTLELASRAGGKLP